MDKIVKRAASKLRVSLHNFLLCKNFSTNGIIKPRIYNNFAIIYLFEYLVFYKIDHIVLSTLSCGVLSW